jgi:hypothetical protein
MDEEIKRGLIAGVIGGAVAGLAGGLVVLLVGLLKMSPKCPNCGEPMPRFRKPANRRQFLWGGWTCTKCGCEMDRRGRRIEAG